MGKTLPVLENHASSINKDGSRNFIHPADVKGKWTTSRNIVFAVLMVIYLVLPFIDIGGHPAVFLDFPNRRFYLFGGTFNAQDFWMMFFLLTGLAFAIIILTTIWGRVWCGYACPQTVFLEGVFRRVERWIEGPRNVRMKRNKGPWNVDKVWRKTLKHTLFILLSLFFSHFFLSYFISLPALMDMIGRPPGEHMEAFIWMASLSVILYGNFAWFREQLCVIICPYGRLQSTMTDKDTKVVLYDHNRGEPRGKAKKKKKGAEAEPVEAKGDCIDCGRCVQVCPTGIDIRNGLQLECIGCYACVDACDTVMDKVKKPRGLVRYDSLNSLDGERKGILRPRLAIYVVVILAWIGGLTYAVNSRESFEANLLRTNGGVPFIMDDGVVQNMINLHIVNKTDARQTYHVVPIEDPNVPFDYTVSMSEVNLNGGSAADAVVIVRLPQERMRSGLQVRFSVTQEGGDTHEAAATFLGPSH